MRLANLLAGVASAIGLVAGFPQAPYDLLIIHGRLIDGTGAPARSADLALRDGRIVRIGELGLQSGGRRIDADGLVVSPGFVDVEAETDTLVDRPSAEKFLQAGVTTVVAGTGGASALDIGDTLDRLRAGGLSINYATLIGHNTVRLAVMGTDRRDPSITELDHMRSLVFKGMADGAIGFSTGLHVAPGSYAHNSEVVALARVAANEHGIYAARIRDQGVSLEQAVAEATHVAETLDMALEISGLVTRPARPGGGAIALKLIDDARRRGVDIMAEQDPNAAAASPPPRPDDVGVLLRHPMVAIASDPPRVLADLVRDRRVISLEEAIRKMTSLPAGHFGLAGRGVIREGAAADLVIFDPALVRDSVAADPSVRSPEGIASVIVNGVVVVREGELSAARPGQVLRRQQ